MVYLKMMKKIKPKMGVTPLKKRCFRRNSLTGFTIVELMVSALLLGILSVSVVYSINYGIKIYRQVHIKDSALEALKGEMADILVQDYNSVAAGGFNVSDYTNANISGLTGSIDSVTEIAVNPGIKEVFLSVSYVNNNDFPIGKSCGIGCSRIRVTMLKREQ